MMILHPDFDDCSATGWYDTMVWYGTTHNLSGPCFINDYCIQDYPLLNRTLS